MNRVTAVPKKFNELATASVYCQLLNGDVQLLRPVYDASFFDVDLDGAIRYYKMTVDGSYVRAGCEGGDFVKAILPSGEEVFFHYSQVFQPTREVQSQMGITTQVLAVAYQNANRQMAIMSEFVREAEKINADISRFRDIFNDLSTLCSGCDPASPRMALPFAQGQLEALEKLKITSPIGALHTRSLPQLYARVIQPDWWWRGYEWEFFFIDVDENGKLFKNVVHEDRVCYGRFGKPNDPPEYDLAAYMDDAEAKGKPFTGESRDLPEDGSDTFDTLHHERWYGGFTPSVYYRCVFMDDGRIAYEHVCGGKNNGAVDKVYELFAHGVGRFEKNVKPYFCGAIRKTLEEIRKSGENGYITEAETQKILGTVQTSIDYGNNRLQGVITRVTAVNNEMEQSFAVATATIEATGEVRRRVLSNAR
ncbi:MAG: hypothetical protein LBF26_01270 [Puniceicoccales bacterium]|jgi:hypothetical protein|nr:hypothetical protein [Puniceicoccales bacterium]